MGQEVLFYLSLIIGISAILTLALRFIRQPPIIAYLISGVLVGPLFLNLLGASNSAELIQIFAHIGVTFLLFIVGLSLDFRVLKEVGAVSTVAGIFEIGVTGTIGFLIAVGLGFSYMPAIYLGAALAFSSTVVVVKILSDKKEIDTLHGRIAVGILIVEDLVAAIVLMAIPLLKENFSFLPILKELGIVLLLILGVILLSVFVLQRFMDYLARNQEVLFLFGIAWALLLSTLFDKLGFSPEIGALVAGMSLASSKYTLELGGKIKPLRDFFVVLFFVFFGSQLATTLTFNLVRNAIIFSIFVIVGKPLIIMSILRLFGYKKRTNFLAGSSLAQISEFSLILILLGYTLGYLDQNIMSLGVLVAIITIGASSYSMYYSHAIFTRISRLLNLFEGKKIDESKVKEEVYEIVLIGYHRIGYKVMQSIKKMKKKFLIIDYNPKVVLSLDKWNIPAVYGDAGDRNFLSELPLKHAKLIISTVPDEYSNKIIKERLTEINSEATFIATAEQPRQAIDLYSAGVDYVIVPHHLGGDYIADMIEEFKTDKAKYASLGEKHKKDLGKAKSKSNYL